MTNEKLVRKADRENSINLRKKLKKMNKLMNN